MNIASKDLNNRRGESIYLNPYTAEVLPQIEGKDFFMFFFKLHRWLTFEGDTQWIGKNAVALATIACIILTIGGVIVYWSRVKNNFLKSFTFSFKSKNRAFYQQCTVLLVCGLFHFSYLCVLLVFIGRMIGIEVQCLLLCKLNNQKELQQLLK
ncbi:MAG: PepSY domain-containing protein [Arcobacter sp.]|nr:PepSY domain-containing protein [Arcobacter sp.]